MQAAYGPGEMALFKTVKKIEKAFVENGSTFFSEDDFKTFFCEELKQNGIIVEARSNTFELSVIPGGGNGGKDIYLRLLYSWGKTIPEVEKWVGEELERLKKWNNSYLLFYDQSGKLVEKDITKVAREARNNNTKVVYFNLENKETYIHPPELKTVIN